MADEEIVDNTNINGDNQYQFDVDNEEDALNGSGDKTAHHKHDNDTIVKSNIKSQPSQANAFESDDDPMHVDFNEDQWIPCIPCIGLTGATIIAAILGIAVGLAISLSPPHTEMKTMEKTFTMNITQSQIENSTDQNLDNIVGLKIIDGEYVFYYEETRNVTEEVPYSHLTEAAEAVLEFPGKIWIAALKLLVLPLVTMMMIVLPSRVDNIGPIGKIAIPLYLFTSTCAAIQGTCWAWIIQPGNIGKDNSDPISVDAVDASGDEVTIADVIFNVVYNAVPPNIVAAMADLSVLGVIVFFLGLGVLLRHENVKKEERNTVLNASHAILRCCMLAIVWVVWFTPIAMFFLIALKIAQTTDLINLVAALGMYLLCVAVGHTIHTFVFYPVLFWCTTRLNGWLYYVKIFPAALLAFATSSSAATLPRSLQVAEKAGVRKEAYSFIIPLGAAINMDGTALGFPIMIALIAQLNDVPLDFGKIIVVMILSIVISVGTAPIPNVGMVYLTMLFEAAGIGHLAGEGIATLFVLDWLVDRIETTVNVTSDQYVAKITDVLDLRRNNKKNKQCCWCCIVPKGDQQGYEQTETELQ